MISLPGYTEARETRDCEAISCPGDNWTRTGFEPEQCEFQEDAAFADHQRLYA